MSRSIILLSFTCLVMMFACRKSTSSSDEIFTIVAPFPSITNYQCDNSPNYGDSIICPIYKDKKGYILKPIANLGKGTWFAWPQGMIINSSNGEINVTQSETGIRYIIGFVKVGTQDTCLSNLILGGITYIDGIHVLGNNDTLAKPYVNANPLLTSICDQSDDNDYPANGGNGNTKCEFDDDEDDDGNSYDEAPSGQQANDKKIRVRTISGIINLKKSFDDGVFGINPQNGAYQEATIYYRLNDCSQKALQKIKVKLIYYNKKSDIPLALVNEVSLNNIAFFQSSIVAPNSKPRPPLIIVTRTN